MLPPPGSELVTLIFSEPIFTVEHEWELLDSLLRCNPAAL
jgi:hypothetical protein